MKVSPAAGPGAIPLPNSVPTQAANAARAKAVAMIQGNATPKPTAHSPQLNQNALSPEDMSAVRPPSVPTPNIDTSTPSEEDTQVAQDPTQNASTEAKDTPAELPVSSQLALLSRKEKALRFKQQQQDQAFKAREEAIKARETAADAKEREYQSGYVSKADLKKQTLKMLAEADVSYEDLTQQVLNQSQTNPYTEAQIARLEAKIQELTASTEESKKIYSSQQEQALEAATKQIRMDVRNLVKSDPAYETVRATNSVNDVVDLIKKTYEQDGYVMSIEDATQEVEDYLIEEAIKLTKIQKIQKRLQPAASTPPKQSDNAQTLQPNKQPQQMKTLTNATGSTRPLSARERAIAAMEGKLK